MRQLEETLMALLLGAMALVTFANVIARYAFNANILWALETTVFLFGWLVLLGASHAVRIRAHLGVDVLISLLPPRWRQALGMFSSAACLAFAILLLKGAWDYWAVFADLPPTSGRWFPTGLDWDFRSQSFYETQDIPMLALFRFLETWINYGESYEKLPRVVPYTVLPLSMLLLTWRFGEAALQIWRGKSDRLVASHEEESPLVQLDGDNSALQGGERAQTGRSAR